MRNMTNSGTDNTGETTSLTFLDVAYRRETYMGIDDWSIVLDMQFNDGQSCQHKFSTGEPGQPPVYGSARATLAAALAHHVQFVLLAENLPTPITVKRLARLHRVGQLLVDLLDTDLDSVHFSEAVVYVLNSHDPDNDDGCPCQCKACRAQLN